MLFAKMLNCVSHRVGLKNGDPLKIKDILVFTF
jgi:hypothetical protein